MCGFTYNLIKIGHVYSIGLYNRKKKIYIHTHTQTYKI